MANRLTVLIPCKNERRHVRAAIASAQAVADEILIADSGSTDGTDDIGRQMGCRVIEREYRTSGDFKNWAIPQAAGEWVLILDADEQISPELANEIRELLAGDPRHDGYKVPRLNKFFGRVLRRGAWRKTWLFRLFRRDLGRYVGDTDHAEVEVPSGKVRRLRQPLLHDAIWSYDRYLPKLYRYADVQARLWHAEGRRTSLPQLVLRAPLRFLQDYILRAGFLEGAAGLQACVLVAFGSYLKQARLWELQHGGRKRPAALPQHSSSHAPVADDEFAEPRRVGSAA